MLDRRTGVRTLRGLLPNGGGLPPDLWASRHRAVLVISWLHALAIPIFALIQGYDVAHGLVDAAPVALLAGAASLRRASGPRTRSVLGALALLTASALLVHLSGGSTEMHFHFFVMIALIALYQDWITFLAAIAFVAVHHGLIGVLAPGDVYDHASGTAKPLVWALVHALFVLAASAAQITNWRITEFQHERSEAALRESEQRFRSLIEHSSDCISVVGLDGRNKYDSPSVERVFGASAVGSKGYLNIHPDDRDMVLTMFASLQPGESELVELRLGEPDAAPRWIEARIANMVGVPGVDGVVVNFREITERKELQERLLHQAFHDTLTGLPNRALFADRIEHALRQRRTGRSLAAVLFIDLDDFKTVNDALGHAAGDEVLIEVSRRIARCLRPGDTCARLGGDEFGVLLEDVSDPTSAYDVAARVLEALRPEIDTTGSPVTLNASIGVAFNTGTDDGDLIRDADLAMYQAKAQGKGRLEIFEDAMRDAVLDRLALKLDMHRALAMGEFINLYQPVVSLETGGIVGAEALVRWEHPERGLLTPFAFVELAEENGMIVSIGRAVLARACADAVSWPSGPSGPLGISVNLSVRQLQHDDLLADVTEILRETGLDPARLTLEITESVLVADPTAAARALAALKQLGVAIAIDDFGTGYSSLSYLHRFPVDSLKVDKTFVDTLGDAAAGNEHALIEAIIGLGQTLELTVVAEGIERAEQWSSLQRLGCGLGQGYLFAKPMPNEQLVDELRPSTVEAALQH